MAERKFITLDNLTLYKTKSDVERDNKDTQVLADAKAYADGLAKNYEAAGAAATAESNAKAYADEKVTALADGQVKLNKEAIEKLNGGVEVEGSVAKAIKDAKDLIDADVKAVDEKADKNAEDIAAINHETTGILATANKYTDDEVAKVQGEVDALETLVGELPEGTNAATVIEYVNAKTAGIATDTALAELQAAVDAIEADYLVEADKTELAEDITANTEAIAVLNGNTSVDGSVDKKIADAINKFATDISDDDTVNTYKELIDYAASHGSEFTTLVGEVDANTAAIETLNGDATKAGSVAKTVADAIAPVQTDLDAVEAKVANLETAVGGTGSVATAIATAKQEAIDEATTKANQALTDAKAYTDAEIDKVEAVVETKATQTGLTALTERVAANEGNITTLSASVLSHDNDITTLKTQMAEFTEVTAAEIQALFN